MANALYSKFKEGLLNGDIALDTDNVKAVLVDTGAYTINLATHDFLDDIAVGARIATSGNLANKTTLLGVFDADDVTFTGVAGVTVEMLVLYVDTGTAGTSRLICAIDTATGLVLTPSGSDVIAQWHASGIFAL